jgi:RimJ/RimL family protein N-acetyltransferase
MVVLGDQLYTRRLLLRRIREADLPLILAWSHSETAYGLYLTPERLSIQTLEEQFARHGFWHEYDRTFIIEDRASEQPIGTIHYWLKQGQSDSAVISVKIAESPMRGQGYGTEAQKNLIIHLFDQVGVKRVDMYTDLNNQAQQHCLAKLGFSLVESLTYDDGHVPRMGHLFQLTEKDYQEKSLYRYHYE